MSSPLLQPAPLNKTNLIVNYLPQNYTDADFHELFSTAGVVTASKIIRDRATGYSYGFGFIDYGTEEEAENAIQCLNGHSIGHKRIKVSYARQGDNVKGANLYLRHLPKELTEQDLETLFSPYGNIVQARVLNDNNGVSRGVGFVLFSTRVQAENALAAMNGVQPPGFLQPLSVKFAEDNKLKMRPNPMAPVSATNIPLGYGGGAAMIKLESGGGVRMYMGAGDMCYSPTGNGGVGPMRSNQPRARFNPMLGAVSAGGAIMPGAMLPGTVVGGMGDGRGMVGVTQGGFVLFVYNIGGEMDEFALWQLFSPYGAVLKVSVVRDYQKNVGKGYGFVTMLNYVESINAIQALNGQIVDNHQLQVSFKK